MSFRSDHIGRLRSWGGLFCYSDEGDDPEGGGVGGTGSDTSAGESEAADNYGGDDNNAGLGNGWGGFDQDQRDAAAREGGRGTDAAATADQDAAFDEARDQGAQDRGVLDFALGIITAALGPVAAVASMLGVEAYSRSRAGSARTVTDIGYAQGFKAGPQRSTGQHLAGAALAVGPLVGLPPGVAKFGGPALDLATLANLEQGKADPGGFDFGGGDYHTPLGSWTDARAVANLADRSGLSLTEAQATDIAQQYNNAAGWDRADSAPVHTAPDRYAYLTSGWKK